MSGGVLLSHTLAGAVPSALESLACVIHGDRRIEPVVGV
jgi:hypothetical protein